MPLDKKIGQMKKQGLDDETITTRLQEAGISPREINEGLEQTGVKPAIGEEMQPSMMSSAAPLQQPATQEMPTMPMAPPLSEALPPSTPEETLTQPPPPEPEAPKIQEQPLPPQPTIPTTEEMSSGLTPNQQPLTQEPTEAYPHNYDYEYPEYEYQPTVTDTEMLTEIAEQLIDEKLQKIEKQISSSIKFKTEMQGKVNNIEERLRRIETMIDRLQTSILGEIGNYGKNIADLKQEMITTQESFSKILNPLTENIKELRKITNAETETEKTKTRTTKSRKKSKDGFENYLRS